MTSLAFGPTGDGRTSFLTLAADGSFKYIISDKVKQVGTWELFMEMSCQKNQPFSRINFSNITSIGKDSKLFSENKSVIYTLNNFTHLSRQRIEICTGYKGGSYCPYFIKVENIGEHDELIAMLNKLSVGKLHNGITRLHLKPDHVAVQYNSVNQSDVGTWFWTYEEYQGQIHCYLWLALGRTYGLSKYEFDIEKSSETVFYLKNVNSDPEKASFNPWYKDNTIEVPEDIVGLRLDEILWAKILGSAIVGSLSNTNPISMEFKELLNGNFKNPTSNIYAKMLSEIRQLKNR